MEAKPVDETALIRFELDRLREENRLLLAVQTAAVGEHWKFWGNVAGSLIVGLLTVAIVGFAVDRGARKYQYTAKQFEIERHEQSKLLEQRYQFLESFSDGFPDAVRRTYRKQDAYIWLCEHTDPAFLEPYTGMPREDFLRCYDKELEPKSLDAPTLQGLAVRARAYFTSDDVRSLADELFEQCIILDGTDNKVALENALAKINAIYCQLIDAMSQEMIQASGARP